MSCLLVINSHFVQSHIWGYCMTDGQLRSSLDHGARALNTPVSLMFLSRVPSFTCKTKKQLFFASG